MHKILTICCIVLISLFLQHFAMAQTQEQLKVQTVRPNLIVEDVLFYFNALNTVELKATEVDAFLELKNFYQVILKNAESKSFMLADTIYVDIPVTIANNSLFFMQRISMTGADALKYKRFQNALSEAIRVFKEENK